MTNALIVDDHSDLRASLAETLACRSVIGETFEASSGEEALEFLSQRPVELVVLDVWMPGMGGVSCCREIKNRWPGTRVLILTSNQEEEAVIGCVMAGADGYVIKKSGRQEFLRALDRVLVGDQFVDPEITAIVFRKLRPAQPVDELTERESEILALIARGATNREIGEALHLTEKTARNYVARLLEKLGFSRRSQAAAYASHRGHGQF
ncbi:response regulator transcription factor [bacterium]|nr:response regulator transcription factor [bacterium]